jgi:hypothetical protein
MILERYSALNEAISGGREYLTPLNPPPGDPAVVRESPMAPSGR